MVDWIEHLLERAGDAPGLAEFVILGLAAALEYVVPPVPGDLVVLFGAFLVGAKGWSPALVVTAVTLGSALGMSADYAFGRWVSRHDAEWRARYPRWRRFGRLLDRVHAVFARWGTIYIALNRFLPAVRAAFFVAAGIARLRYWKVLVWGVVSALLWNAFLFAVGLAVGHNREAVFGFFDAYAYAAWGVLAVVVVAWLVRRAWRRPERRRAAERDGRDGG